MSEYKKQRCNLCMGFLIGGVLGALAGILFAPKSGKELRSDLNEKGREVLKDAEEIYAGASTKVKEIIEKAKQRVGELGKEADRSLSTACRKAKEIWACGENKEGEAGESAKDIAGGGEVSS